MGQSPVAKVYLQKRAGKSVTIISGLHTYGSQRLEKIAKDLKTSLATGGTLKDGVIEIQGDKVDTIKQWFKNLKSKEGAQ